MTAEVAVLGGGYAGLRACKEISKHKLDVNVTLVNRDSYHYDSTMLMRLAAGTAKPGDITFEIKDVINKNVKFIQDEVVKIDKDANKVQLKNHPDIKFDYLINSLGFQPATFGIPGVKEYGLGLSDVKNSVYAYDKTIKHLSNYAKSHDPKDLTIIVGGDGFTSIEYLGELVDKLPELAKKYNFNVSDVKMICIGAGNRVLPMFDEKLAQYAVNFLEKKGVTFVLGEAITEVNAHGVKTTKQSIAGNTVIWATGVEGSFVVPDSGYKSKRNEVLVENDMTVPGYPNQFFIGDVAAVMDDETKRPFPTTGQISIQEANIAVANLKAKLEGTDPVKFFYNSEGTVCSLGVTSGIAEVILLGKTIKVKGLPVVPLKHIVAKKSTWELSNIKTALQSY